MTAQDIITSALRRIGVIASEETPTGAEASDSLVVLNDMIDQWNAESLSIFTEQPHEFNLTTSQTYTLGTGGDFNMTRPARIDRAVLKVSTNPTFPLELPLTQYTDEQWASITLKSLPNTYPEGYWDDGGFPLRTLYFWPIPSGVSLSVVLYCWEPLTSFASLTTDHTFPPGYAKAIRYNLAVELASEFDVPQLNPIVAATAQSSKAAIQMFNASGRVPLLTCDRAVQSPSTIPGVSRADFLGGRF